MSTVREIPAEALESALARLEERKLKSGPQPPDNGDMEARFAKLEAAVAGLPTKADFAELRADLADGRADVHKAIAENHRWTHTALIGMASLSVIGILGLLLTIWNAGKAPPTAQAATQQPIIITIPQAAPLPQAPSSVAPTKP